MKHGPIALVDEQTPSLFLIPRGAVFDKVMSNLEEFKARGGPVIAVTNEQDEEVAALVEEVIYVPDVPEYLQPLVAVIPLQLLAYHIALMPRLRRRPAPQPCQKCYGGVKMFAISRRASIFCRTGARPQWQLLQFAERERGCYPGGDILTLGASGREFGRFSSLVCLERWRL